MSGQVGAGAQAVVGNPKRTIVENLTPEPPPSDLGGPKLADTARPTQMAQTPTVEEEKPNVSCLGIALFGLSSNGLAGSVVSPSGAKVRSRRY
jgi:hypothetical protein